MLHASFCERLLECFAQPPARHGREFTRYASDYKGADPKELNVDYIWVPFPRHIHVASGKQDRLRVVALIVRSWRRRCAQDILQQRFEQLDAHHRGGAVGVRRACLVERGFARSVRCAPREAVT